MRAQRFVKIGADRELIAVYPRRADISRELFRELIAAARSRLWFGGYTSYFVWLDAPGAASALGEKTQQGADIRFLLSDPDSEVASRRETIESSPFTVSTRIALSRAEIAKSPTPLPVRVTDRHIAMSVWVFDDDAIVSTHIGDGLGQDSVTYHLRRQAEGGAFDRYVQHFELLWTGAATVPAC